MGFHEARIPGWRETPLPATCTPEEAYLAELADPVLALALIADNLEVIGDERQREHRVGELRQVGLLGRARRGERSLAPPGDARLVKPHVHLALRRFSVHVAAHGPIGAALPAST